jgi:hypothetical protein
VQALRDWWTDRVSAPRPLSWTLRDGIVRSARLEVNAVAHCNLSCRACSHLSPVAAKSAVDPAALARDLALLAPVYRADELRIVGGEPLLHPQLLDLVGTIRASRIAERIELVTNGVLLDRAPDELWQALDGVEVSSYPGKELTAAARRRCRGRADAAGVRLNVRAVTRFRESYSELGTEDAGLVAQIHAACDLRDYHTLADGRLYRCPQSHFVPRLLGTADADSLVLDGPALGERLLAFLSDGAPRAACRNCLGTSGARFGHVQTSRKEFRAAQERTTEELVDARYLRRRSAPSLARV